MRILFMIEMLINFTQLKELAVNQFINLNSKKKLLLGQKVENQ